MSCPGILIATTDGDDAGIVLRYHPTLLIDAIWQQLAEEIAGLIQCARCPAPKCGRWFLRSNARSDRLYCSPTCRMRVWRSGTGGDVS